MGNMTVQGLNSNIRIYRYEVGRFFGPHYDDSVIDPITGWKSAWTLLVYLNDSELLGGETSFAISPTLSVAPKISSGMALLHRHGHDCLLHEGKPVLRGTKWV